MRVRFAPSPTGYLHIGSARTFIFNWLYARRNGGTVILRIDDTDLERNTEASLNSIFEGLGWLELGWDEQYRQSERLDLHRRTAEDLLARGHAYRDFTPAHAGEDPDRSSAEGPWLFNEGARELSTAESDRRASAGEPYVVRFRVPRDADRTVHFQDLVFGDQARRTADIEDFALLRSNAMPTYHMASCADDADLQITHIIRGQDHLPNTFKHVLLFEALGTQIPEFAHLPLLIAPDGAKLSKRKHGPVVSVGTYRDAGFLPHAYVNFLCLLGWNPKDERERMTREELVEAFRFEGVNRSNAVVNFTEEDPLDPKALWLNAQHIYAMPPDELTRRLLPWVRPEGAVNEDQLRRITPLIQERIRTLSEVSTVADFFLNENLAPYDASELIPQKGDVAMAVRVLEHAAGILETAEWTHSGLEASLRQASADLGIKAGQMFTPVRVAVCGRKNAPPLFETIEVLGRERTLQRVRHAAALLRNEGN
ncbi:MAG TPA: glutamate--tRNA ligase [Bryobacteraceae bacterium]|nr:glutamate--tRNA ligase [Bryobacteraceae bacterium]